MAAADGKSAAEGAMASAALPSAITDALDTHWGGLALRPAQHEAIMAVLSSRDSFVGLRTGYGKSLCFQAPAAARPGVTVVITPLLALAQDQLCDLDERNVCAARHTSDVDPDRRARLVADLEEDDPETKLLYLTPEGLAKEAMLEVLRALHSRRLVNAIAVDEAHCVSEWGQGFRPEYRLIADARESLGTPLVPIQAFTATATASVRDDIIKCLRLRTPAVITGSNDRPNIFFEVVDGSASGGGGAEEAAFVSWVASTGGTGIVYCRTKKEVDRVADLLCDADIDCEAYHAGKDPARRKRIQDDWTDGSTRVVVATIAFGMGVNKRDVRWVVHWDPPSSLENLLQEAGRAGRDGLPAIARLFYTPSRLPALDSPLSPKADVRRLCTATASACRRAMLLSHFEPAARRIGTAAAAAASAAAARGEESPSPERCCDLCARRAAGGHLPPSPTISHHLPPSPTISHHLPSSPTIAVPRPMRPPCCRWRRSRGGRGWGTAPSCMRSSHPAYTRPSRTCQGGGPSPLADRRCRARSWWWRQRR